MEEEKEKEEEEEKEKRKKKGLAQQFYPKVRPGRELKSPGCESRYGAYRRGNCAYNTTLQCNTTLLPSVNTLARGMFCGAKYTHQTFTPIIKIIKLQQQQINIQVKSHS